MLNYFSLSVHNAYISHYITRQHQAIYFFSSTKIGSEIIKFQLYNNHYL